MAKLYIYTQDQENYGAHDWDGEGECPQYWKNKGGMDFFVQNVKWCSEQATAIVMALRDQIEESNSYFVRSIIGWEIVADDFMTEFEKSQLDYEGTIQFPAKILEWN